MSKDSPSATNGECRIVYRDERWWFIRPNGQWVGPYMTKQIAEGKATA